MDRPEQAKNRNINTVLKNGAYLPVMENGHTKGLTLCMSAQIGFESKRIDDWNERLYCVKRRSRNRCIGCNVTTTLRQNSVRSANAISRCNHFNGIVRLHKTRSCHLNVKRC
jgi:hypothetical protein